MCRALLASHATIAACAQQSLELTTFTPPLSHPTVSIMPMCMHCLRESPQSTSQDDSALTVLSTAMLLQVAMVKPGDASMASPFTAKQGHIMPCTDILKQGRSTLVTTVQMFKILGLLCLSTAYSLSVMYLQVQ